MNLIALHEAAHATVARLLGVRVKHAIAAGDYPHVTTLTPRKDGDPDELANWQRRLAVIDFAGAIVEDDPNGAAAVTDRENAFARSRQAIALEDGVNVEKLDDIQLEDASALYQHLAAEAAALVKANFPLVARVAFRLEDLGELSGSAVDAVLLELQV